MRSHGSIVVVPLIKSILLCVVNIVIVYLEISVIIVPSNCDFKPGYVSYTIYKCYT